MPHGHWKTTTFVAGLRLSDLAAPFVLDGSINRDAFQTSVERVLVPELAPGDTVVMDNLGSHTGPAGARLLFLPPGSPDFNPIEMAFSKLKALLRKAAERTVEGLWAAIGRLIDTITPDECANFCAAAGYEPDQIENALAKSIARRNTRIGCERASSCLMSQQSMRLSLYRSAAGSRPATIGSRGIELPGRTVLIYR